MRTTARPLGGGARSRPTTPSANFGIAKDKTSKVGWYAVFGSTSFGNDENKSVIKNHSAEHSFVTVLFRREVLASDSFRTMWPMAR